MDASCGLCAKGAHWIAKHDHERQFRIVPMQSQLGSALMRHYAMDPGDPTSWLFVQDGLAYVSLDAMIRVGRVLGGLGVLLTILRILPRTLQDKLYGYVARRRHRFFKPVELCELPDPDIQSRLLL